MKFISIILIAYITLLTVLPAVCKTYVVLKQAELCCSDKNSNQCSKDQKDKSENNMSCTACCSIQNCNCNFVGIPQFDFLIQNGTTTKKAKIQDDKILSNYLSDCWHPPKIVWSS